MMKRSGRSSALGSPAFLSLGVGRLTWLGLFVAAIGWALLIAGAAVPDLVAAKSARPMPPTFHADVMAIARGIIESGFALAIIGALQNGFGTLNRFFGAVLSRSGHRESAPQPVSPHAPPSQVSSSQVSIEGRPYRLFPDGSVEVDTIVGTRRFRSMAEARDFI